MRKLFVTLSWLAPVLLWAQEPVSWSNTVRKIGANSYEIHLKATIASPWHVYSQKTPAGGPLPTSILFSKNPLIKLFGSVKEQGKLVKKHEEVFGIDVLYYSTEVDFIQTFSIKVKANTSIKGTLKYMACNDSQCLPPAEIKFQLPIQ